jgi:5-methyltetrahydrofolate--homocysteine methyltransferase
MVEVVEGVSDDIRIALDSSSADVLKKAIKKVKNPPMINSVSLESKRLSEMKPVLTEREASVVGLCMDDRGMPKDAETVFDNATRLVKELEGLGISRDRIYLDPLVQAVSADSNMGVIALDSMRLIREGIEGVNIICGLSNISFGLPKRWLINRMFIALAMGAGLNSAIMDPLDRKMMSAITVTEMLLGKDEYCRNFMTKYRKKMIED